MEDSAFDDLLLPQDFLAYRSLIIKYTESLTSKKKPFFDIEEFEVVIDYFIAIFEIEQAKSSIDEALSQHPNCTSILLRKANILLMEGNNIGCSRLLENLVSIEPFNNDIHLVIAKLHKATGEYVKAIASYKHVIKNCDWEEKEDLMFELAMIYSEIEDNSSAIDLLVQITKENPKEEYALYELQLSLMKSNRLSDAIKIFNDLIDINPYSVATWFNLGVSYGQMERNAEALEAYDYALAINEKHSPSMFNKGNSLYKLEEYEKALLAYQNVVELENPMAITYCNMGECHEQLKQFDLAIKYYKKSLAMDPNFADAYIGCAIATDLLGDINESISYIERALNISPQNKDYLHFYAEILKKAELYDEAALAYKKTLETYNNDLNIYLGYFDCLFKINKDDEALEVVTFAFKIIGNNDELSIRLLALLTRQGKIKKAAILLETLLNTNKDIGSMFLSYHPQAINNREVIDLLNEYK